MSKSWWLVGIALLGCVLAAEAGTTVKYSYDAQYRLVQADYGGESKVLCSYDAAGNLDEYMAITDVSLLRSFLIYFSCINPSGGFLWTTATAPSFG